MPVCRGEILFTTRDVRILDHPGLVPVSAGIEASRMTKEEAMETFCRIAGSKRLVNSPATGQLLTLLDGLPLAIAQVAAYIQTTHTSTKHYLALFQESERHQEARLSEMLPAALRTDETDISRAVMTTCALSVQRLERKAHNQ